MIAVKRENVPEELEASTIRNSTGVSWFQPAVSVSGDTAVVGAYLDDDDAWLATTVVKRRKRGYRSPMTKSALVIGVSLVACGNAESAPHEGPAAPSAKQNAAGGAQGASDAGTDRSTADSSSAPGDAGNNIADAELTGASESDSAAGGSSTGGAGPATGGNTATTTQPGNAGTPSGISSGGNTGAGDAGTQAGLGGVDAGARPQDASAEADAGSADGGVVMAGTGGLSGTVPDVLADLEDYLAMPRADRTPLEDATFAAAPLTKEQTQQATVLLWEDYAEFIRETRQAEHAAKAIVLQDRTLRYDFRTFGDKPADGWSLFISLHGGGNADPSVNDEQWTNQMTLYQPDEGIYLCPRAPTDTWNLWHEAHIDPMFERLIGNLVVLEDVNPDRVYVMGYSAGGDGVYQLGPRMADHWAAASAMAGHPNDAEPLSLRNIGFTIHVGELDTDYDRNLVAQEWSDQLDQLEAADPGGYAHEVQIHGGKPHWMDLEDAVAVPWMAEFTRNPTPAKIVWYQDDITHERFYWLSVRSAQPMAATQIVATLEGQLITLESSDVPSITVRLSDAMLDLDQQISILANGTERFAGTVSRTIATLSRTLQERGDPRLVFSAEVPVEL